MSTDKKLESLVANLMGTKNAIEKGPEAKYLTTAAPSTPPAAPAPATSASALVAQLLGGTPAVRAPFTPPPTPAPAPYVAPAVSVAKTDPSARWAELEAKIAKLDKFGMAVPADVAEEFAFLSEFLEKGPAVPTTDATPPPAMPGPDGAGTAINPPNEFQRAPTEAEQIAAAAKEKADEKAAEAEEAAEESAATPSKPKGKGGRPKKGSKNKATLAEMLAGGQTAETVEVVETPATETECRVVNTVHRPTTPSPESGGFTLYVDCLPVGGSGESLEEILLVANERIFASHQVADYRYIDYKGAAVLHETLVEMVKDGTIHGSVFMSAKTPQGAIALAALAPLAKFPVVRGLG